MNQEKKVFGKIEWIDLTVENAEDIIKFYEKVVGWKSDPIAMGEYNDYCMIPVESDHPVSGICHARGSNKDIPSQWMIYITVENLDNSLQACLDNGGKKITEVRKVGNDRFVMVKDPAGACFALYEKA